MSKSLLTRRQTEILDFIKHYDQLHGWPPQQVDIMKQFNLSSKATAHQHVETLIKKGYLKRSGHGQISLIRRGRPKNIMKTRSIPLYGNIPASPPTEVYPEDNMIEVPETFLGIGDHFALEVKGDSMMEADINDGDMVFLRRQSTARNGEIIAALIDNCEVTLKEFRRAADMVILQPHNREMDPIVIKDRPFEIQGVMVGLYRKYL